jgi:hypothetical protein
MCAAVPTAAGAQTARERSPQQVADSSEIAQLARTLTRGATTDSVRAARLYEWVARNLTYDVRGFLNGRLADGTPENVYRKRLAVCGGYVALFQRLAREAGLQAEPILGYAKGFTYRSGASTRRANHSWVALKLGNDWRLLDPTWASGFVANGKFERQFSWDYFLVDPDILILSHFPEEDRWQLLRQQVRRKDFERMPLVPRTLVSAGFDPAAIRSVTLTSGVRSYPLVGLKEDVRIIAAPVNGVLPRQATVSFVVEWPGATDVALVSGGIWRHLVREGNRFRGETVASESSVSLVGRTNRSQSFETLLQYQVQ